MKRSLSILLVALLGIMNLDLPVAAKVYLYAPDGTEVEIKEGTPQPDLSRYRSPLESRVASRRFVTSDQFYLANEEFLSGSEFFVDARKASAGSFCRWRPSTRFLKPRRRFSPIRAAGWAESTPSSTIRPRGCAIFRTSFSPIWSCLPISPSGRGLSM